MHLAALYPIFVNSRMAEKLITALIQADLDWENAEANRKKLETQIDQLEGELDLILLPEMFTTGFSMNAENLAEPHQGPSFKWMQKIARERNSAITGSIITSEKGRYYNRLYFVFPDGSSEKYDKRHTFTLAKEHETYDSGTERLIVEYKGWKICPLVCYDLRFPVWARNTVDYDLLLYVANWPAPRVHAWDTLLPARAIENMAYCIGLNRVGTDGKGLDYLGHSAVYDSLGKAVSFRKEEAVFNEVVELEKAHLKETREQLRFLLDRDKFSLQ
jgi:omega-amidase